MKIKLKIVYLLSMLIISLLINVSCVAYPAQEDGQDSNQREDIDKVETVIVEPTVVVEVVQKVETAVVVQVVVPKTPRPKPTRRTVESEGDTVEIQFNINKMPNVILKLNQKLIIIPDWKSGEEEWWVYTANPNVLLLDPKIDHTKPPKTGWVWTPQRIGKTIINISEPSFCPKCVPGPPITSISFKVTVVDTP